MATRYLTALDFTDWHAHNVLKKHAKKRPLGDLETRYHYTPPQPVLSCRSVDIDLSGTRTYRPRSTTDILDEQQLMIRRLFKDSRSAGSAPVRRTTKKGHFGQVGHSEAQRGNNIHILGRPCTSVSQASDGSNKHKGSKSRSGRLKNVKSATESFMVVAVDEDLLETKRSYNDLTSRIHDHWRPESSNLNQGHFIRGKKRPDQVPPTLDAWLTFGGAPGVGEGGGAEGAVQDSGGVVDAFATISGPDDYYNIEGSVGSRVAQQLQKGGRIRIGINGEVHTHDLKVKKWVRIESEAPSPEALAGKGEATGKQADAQGEADDEIKNGTETDKEQQTGVSGTLSAADTGDDLLGELNFETLDDDLLKENDVEETQATGEEVLRTTSAMPADPVSLEDLMSRPEVKVISPRRTPRDSTRENLCETRPVLYNTAVAAPQLRPKLARSQTSLDGSLRVSVTTGYRIKQRPLGCSQHPALKGDHPHRLDSASGSKVRAFSCDPNSREDEERLSSLSVDDVVQMRREMKGDSASAEGSQSAAGGAHGRAETGAGRGDQSSGGASAPTAGSKKPGERPRSDDAPPPRAGTGGAHPRSYSAAATSASNPLQPGIRHHQQHQQQQQDWRFTASGRMPGRPSVMLRPSSSSVPVPGQLDVDLAVIKSSTPRGASGLAGLGRFERLGSEKGGRGLTRALGLHHRNLGMMGVSSINAGPIPGDTEFIQISHPIRNPNPHHPGTPRAGVVVGMKAGYSPFPLNHQSASTPASVFSPPRSNTPEFGLLPTPRSLVMPHASAVSQQQQPLSRSGSATTPGLGQASRGRVVSSGVGGNSSRQANPPSAPQLSSQEPSHVTTTTVTATAGTRKQSGLSLVSDARAVPSQTATTPPATTLSASPVPSSQAPPSPLPLSFKAISIPTAGRVEEEEEDDLTVTQRREKSMRDAQIHQITDLLAGAIVNTDN